MKHLSNKDLQFLMVRDMITDSIKTKNPLKDTDSSDYPHNTYKPLDAVLLYTPVRLSDGRIGYVSFTHIHVASVKVFGVSFKDEPQTSFYFNNDGDECTIKGELIINSTLKAMEIVK